MKIFKKILAVGLGLTMMFSLAGCQEAAPSEAELPEPEAIEEEVNEIVGEAPDEDEIEEVEGWAPIVDVPVVDSAAEAVIGYIYPNSEEYFNNALTYVEQCAGALGYHVVANEAQDDGKKQLELVSEMLDKGVLGLIVSPTKDCPVAEIIEQCNAAAVPVILTERDAEGCVPGKDYLAYIGIDEEQTGYDMAMGLINAGAANMAAVGGAEDDSAAQARKAGLERALEEHPEVTLLDYVATSDEDEDIRAAMEKVYEACPGMDSLWCFDDHRAVVCVGVIRGGAVAPFIMVAGKGLMSDSISLMEGGGMWCSTGGDYFSAGFAAMVLCDTLLGYTYDGPGDIRLGLLTITQDTLLNFEEKYGSGTAVDWAALSRSLGGTETYDFNLYA